MMLECPHCYRHVGVNRDRICPGCQRNVDDTTGINTELVSVWIDAGANISDHCALCGNQTNRKAKITRFGAYEIKPQRDIEDVSLFSIFSLFMRPLWFVLRILVNLVNRESGVPDRSYSKAQFVVPHCELCQDDEIRVIDCIPEKKQIKLVVHRRFKLQFDEANQPIGQYQ